MSDAPLSLEPIKGKRTNSDPERGEKLFTILNNVLQPNASLDPTEAAREIDELAPKFQKADQDEGQRELDIENFMAQLWSLLFAAMQLVPREHLGHERAISLLDALCQVNGDLGVKAEHGPLRWRHLPCLTQYLIQDFWRWNLSFDEREWLNLTSFAARLLGSGLLDAENGVWDLELLASNQLRKLEGDDAQEELEGDLTLAEEWITHAGATIFKTARTNSHEANATSPGWFTRSRENVLSIEQWERWQRRLLELGVDAEAISHRAV